MRGILVENRIAGEGKVKVGKLVLCADDYAISEGVCDAVEDLIALGRIAAAGAMTVDRKSVV